MVLIKPKFKAFLKYMYIYIYIQRERERERNININAEVAEVDEKVRI